jgi:DNA-binding response OmpR family regulator
MSRAKCRILCVDDHEDTSEMLKLLLAQEDYEVVTAISIEEGLRLATTEDFDLYVLDKRLPDGSGIELCERLSAATPEIPCLFYSGDAYEVQKREAIAAGADCYVAKPDIEGLIEGVRKLLAQRECAAAVGAVGTQQAPPMTQ